MDSVPSSNTLITAIKAREILDARGNPTLEVDVHLENGAFGRAAVPTGTSTGKNEALELRDGDPGRFSGMGVLNAVDHVHRQLFEAVQDLDALDQAGLDQAMCEVDGTENKGRLGANAIIAVSMAVARAASASLGLPLYRYLGGIDARTLPVPMCNLINGGLPVDGTVDFQEFMVLPVGASSFHEGVREVAEIFHALKSLLIRKGHHTGVGDEGGYCPFVGSHREALDLILESVRLAGFKTGPLQDHPQILLAVDAAASEMRQQAHHEGQNGYKFWRSSGPLLNSEQMVEFWVQFMEEYPMVFSLEDPMGEDDREGWQLLTRTLGKRVQLVGDDVFSTNVRLLEDGITNHIANAILIKPNQIGTLTETIDTVSLARDQGYDCIVSHRSGETEDTFISDLVVALGTGQMKIGAPARSDRVAKYNQLLRIEEELGSSARYFGRSILRSFENR
ncbi:MAG: phosphopyruvate hydratase [Deltaproteobacteria bacterium HGW-Deltaproteobacteria-17]|nr:MAG: phosphopyruvate hydratase [Deltaproteobacteria bacterium HGW-Deltaproteobacteria-17]